MNTNPTTDLLQAFPDRTSSGQETMVRSRAQPPPIGPPIMVESGGDVSSGDTARHNLLPILRRRRSVRFFSRDAVPAADVMASVARGVDTDRVTWPTRQETCSLQVDAVAFNLDGVPPAIYRMDHTDRSLTPIASIPTSDEDELTLQPEFSSAAVVLSITVDLASAWDFGGAHEYRLLMGRVSSAAYTMWLDAISKGYVGSVFAGFIPAAVRRPLQSDGASRHHAFALALGGTPSLSSLSVAGTEA